LAAISYSVAKFRFSIRASSLSQLSQNTMPYVITEACINTKDRSCVDVCPVDCIYEGPEMLYIHPDECIDCGACEPECPVTAIFPEEDVPANLAQYIKINRDVFNDPNPPGKPQR
jgi:ferredoxin